MYDCIKKLQKCNRLCLIDPKIIFTCVALSTNKQMHDTKSSLVRRLGNKVTSYN